MKKERSLLSPLKKETVEMNLPNSGRIVLIDDKADEVEPLIRALGRLPVPYIYYDGTIENLPPPGKHLGGVRFVFLDIELQGMSGQSRKTKASGITAILKRIISDSNGPYAIIFWTFHEETIEAVLENCLTLGIPPVAWINMEKNRWLKTENSETGEISDFSDNKIEQISESLNEKLKSVDAFLLYIEWENILHSSSKQFIAEFSSLAPVGDNWSQETRYLFHNLYTAVVNKNIRDDQTEQFRYACYLMNRSFLDTLSEKTLTELSLPQGFQLTPGVIEDVTKAKLNTSLFIGRPLTTTPMPGYVYLNTNEIYLTSLKNYMFKKDQAPEDARLCTVIVTPECDVAQNKTIQIILANAQGGPLHRVIFGLYYTISKDLKTEKKKLHERGKDGRFDIGPLWQNDKRYLLSLHTATLSLRTEKSFPEKPLFKLKRDLLFDLQSKAANHINRLGNYQLS